ncbi:conserved hypothetical protein [Nitrosococcus oceani ATCC 19707]|uniref:DUF4139 domain-containing protein n=2 Tax=Nitrosococcus oceani TaxID=1229 RepID=Q3J7L0_NITOC|nr:DUF4139 domain-containing protein [Nitrosococcus oceani]ABA59186.1 conserved hypothetical protein [Nitrosococcus oceani ATCC 19707]EDZ66146.1 hypothetical protein NOC27_2826 [Nitrosococcus oceani AFC27]KFI18354.1 hypothetical protein IB75_14515 [Nitrosococcus oceani C-27]GEM20284.1 DUF4139 domain-containing protein [Nitrosococcus oceani]
MMPRLIPAGALALWILVPPSTAWSQEEIHTTHTDQKKVAITIYNNDLALIKDQRQVALKKGHNTLAFMDVSTGIQSETALLRNLTHPQGFSIAEQNYEFDLLTAEALLQKHVGQQVGVISRHPTTGEETIEQAILLAANPGVILRFKNRIETGISPDRLVYQQIPQDLRERPSLILQLQTEVADKQALELSYLTSGLNWKADYVAQLNQTEDRFDLNGWVTLTNQSGISYQNAHLQLVAGSVHQVTPQVHYAKRPAQEARTFADVPPMEEEGLLDYHLYTLDHTTTLKNNQTKQVALLSAHNVIAQKQYELRSHTPRLYYGHSQSFPVLKPPVMVYLHFDNTQQAGLKLPLPAGIIRVYKQDSRGNTQFVGEDRINHVSKNASAKLRLGQAFDITAKKQRTEYRKLDSDSFEATFKIELRNGKKESVLVKVAEFIPGDWYIITESHPHQRETGNTALWQLSIPAEGQVTLTVSFQTRT